VITVGKVRTDTVPLHATDGLATEAGKAVATGAGATGVGVTGTGATATGVSAQAVVLALQTSSTLAILHQGRSCHPGR